MSLKGSDPFSDRVCSWLILPRIGTGARGLNFVLGLINQPPHAIYFDAECQSHRISCRGRSVLFRERLKIGCGAEHRRRPLEEARRFFLPVDTPAARDRSPTTDAD